MRPLPPRALALHPLRCLSQTAPATPLRLWSTAAELRSVVSHSLAHRPSRALWGTPSRVPAPWGEVLWVRAWDPEGSRAGGAGGLHLEPFVGRAGGASCGKQPTEHRGRGTRQGAAAPWSLRQGAGCCHRSTPLPAPAPPCPDLTLCVRSRHALWAPLTPCTLGVTHSSIRPCTVGPGPPNLSTEADMGAKKRRVVRTRSKGGAKEEEGAVQEMQSGGEGAECSEAGAAGGRGRGRGGRGGRKQATSRGDGEEGGAKGEGEAGTGEGPQEPSPEKGDGAAGKGADKGSKGKGAKGKTAKQALAEAKAVEAEAGRSERPWTVLVHRQPQEGWKPYDPAAMRPQLKGLEAELAPGAGGQGRVWRLLSWNVNGLRALLKDQLAGGAPAAPPIPAWAQGKGRKRKGDGEGGPGEEGTEREGEKGGKGAEGGGVTLEAAAEAHVLQALAEREQADVICLQETKVQKKDCEALQQCLEPHFPFCSWNCSEAKLGYSGTAILSKHKPLSVRVGLGKAEHDGEGRVVALEFPGFYLVSVYVPNSGEGLKRLNYREKEWDPALSDFLKLELEPRKPVILTGDLNVAHQEMDIFHPEGNKRSAGFTDEERQSFAANFLSKGLVDTFRRQHPDAVAYTYWAYRSKARPENRGWRLDYFLVSESLAPQVLDSYTLPDVQGSDHCPIGLILYG